MGGQVLNVSLTASDIFCSRHEHFPCHNSNQHGCLGFWPRVRNTDGLIAKWDASGNVLWFHQLTASYSSLRALSPAVNGDVVVLGSAPRNGSFSGELVTNAFLAQISSTGAVRSVRNISTNANLYDVAADSMGNLLLCGSISLGNGQLGGVFVTNHPGLTAPMTAKLDSNGEVLWIKTADSTNTSNWGEAFSLGVTTRGAVYVTGLLSGNLNFDSATASGVGLFDAFLARIDPEPPLLSIFKSGTNAIVSWPLSAPDWLLRRTAQLGSEWETVTDPIFQNGESFVLTNATTNSTGFFRLELAP